MPIQACAGKVHLTGLPRRDIIPAFSTTHPLGLKHYNGVNHARDQLHFSASNDQQPVGSLVASWLCYGTVLPAEVHPGSYTLAQPPFTLDARV
jgi:hypothetical protein